MEIKIKIPKINTIQTSPDTNPILPNKWLKISEPEFIKDGSNPIPRQYYSSR